MNTNDHRILIYISYIDNPTKIRLVKHNIGILKKQFDKVILVYSSINETELTYTDNFCGIEAKDIHLVHNIGYDFKKMHTGLSEIIDSQFKYATVINDSVMIRGNINSYFLKVENLINEGNQFIGFIESMEKKRHYQSWFWVMTKEVARFIVDNISIIPGNDFKGKLKQIDVNEVGISNDIIDKFKCSSLHGPYEHNPFYTDSQFIIDPLIPFIKINTFDKEFIRKNKLHHLKDIDIERTLPVFVLQLINEYSRDINENVKSLPVSNDIKDNTTSNNVTKPIAICLHVYYTDLWKYFEEKLKRLNIRFDLYVTLCDGEELITSEILKSFPDAKISMYPNRGQDIGPFLQILKKIRGFDYDYIIKLHTKKCEYDLALGSEWRTELVNALISSDKIIERNVKILKTGKFKMCGSSKWLRQQEWEYDNITYNVKFIGGTIFMADFKTITDVIQDELIDEWYNKLPTGYEQNHSFAHVLERLLGQVVIDAGYEIKGV
jgi:hypothetical protein